MINNKFPFELPPLPYPYDALEPFICAETMRYHHDKHFETYITNLNKALEKNCRLQKLTLEELLSNPSIIPPEDREKIMNNAGGVYNHYLFFKGLQPPNTVNTVNTVNAVNEGSSLSPAINRDFGSFENLQKAMTDAALNVFGSGWACLALSKRGTLQVIKLKNQETALKNCMKTIMLIDVWEHAYYLQFQNRRADYVNQLWNVLRLAEIK